MKSPARLAAATAAIIVAFAAMGLVSNAMSADDVERRGQKQCEQRIEQVARHWKLSPGSVTHLPASSIRMAGSTTPEGNRVRVQLPPTEKPPFCYTHVSQAAPFVLRVQYGWAVSGARMAFGQGGEQLVVSVFGRTKTLRDRPAWHF